MLLLFVGMFLEVLLLVLVTVTYVHVASPSRIAVRTFSKRYPVPKYRWNAKRS